jgi:hypothetical protein
MAKQPAKHVQLFLTSLATDSDLLLEFIKNPDRVLQEHEIRDKTTQEQIKNLLAIEVAKKLLVVPKAIFIHW